ncbi:hypothetical protein [Dyella terrae]|uniref:hypothetical protein n=1 Tax=Dyella terrae TaxID=522259 RepID=UPI001EFCDD52|nr:hypothetical protein [Dyella terrae]ULU23433.1 hypothetical protein DYST_00329 [Dyella terrae]
MPLRRRKWTTDLASCALVLATSVPNAHAGQYAAGVCKVADFRVIGTDTPGTSVRPTYDAGAYMSEYQGRSDSPLKEFATDKYPLNEAKTRVLVPPKNGELILDPGTPSNLSAAREGYYYYVTNKGYSGEDAFVMQVEKYGIKIEIHYTIEIPDVGESPKGLCTMDHWMISRVEGGSARNG